jgi:hypothetical protein
MDLQTRKLNLIGYLISIEDEKIFSKIESSISRNRRLDNRVLKPFTQKELVERANIADLDYKAGNIISQELLEIESESW